MIHYFGKDIKIQGNRRIFRNFWLFYSAIFWRFIPQLLALGKQSALACEASENLKIGTKLQFEREADNKFDPYAVAIYYNDLKLGFIPRGENHDISKFLDMGWGDMYEARIHRITPDAHPEEQVEVIGYVKKNADR